MTVFDSTVLQQCKQQVHGEIKRKLRIRKNLPTTLSHAVKHGQYFRVYSQNGFGQKLL